MQPQEEPARCRSSGDAPTTLTVESKGVEFHRIRQVDPRYSVYRWDCGSYPYFKAPAPTSAPCSGIQPAFPPGSLGYPGHVATAPDIYCKGRGECYGEAVVGSDAGQDFLPHQQRCICPDPHDPRYHPHFLGPEAVNWEPTPTGCSCCGQHVVHSHGPHNHPRHVDSIRLYPSSAYRTAGPDVARVYPAARESIDAARQTDAPVQCLSEPSGQGLEHDQPLERRRGCARQPTEETTSCGPTSPGPAAPSTDDPEATENRDARRSNGGSERETSDSVERCAVTTDEDRTDTMTNLVGSLTTGEPKSGKITDTRITPTRSTSKVTPLYGLPSWWGDEPEPDVDQARKYNLPTVTSSSSSSPSTIKKQTELSGSLSLGATRAPISYSCNPSQTTTTKSSSLTTSGALAADSSQHPIKVRADVQGNKHCQFNKDLGYHSIIFEKPGICQGTSNNPPRTRTTENSGTFDVSTFRYSQENFESLSVPQNLKVSGHHSPPERDRPSTGDGEVRHLQHFVYQDPLLPLQLEKEFHVSTYDDDRGSLKCKAPTAFIVDLQEVDDANNSQRRITVKTSLSQFLPPRCERSLQRRLSGMKQKRKSNSAKELGEGRTENEDRGDKAADSRQCFKLHLPGSFKDSFEEAVVNDAIADDVSETGTYTIDVSSDGESKVVADARERILAAFGITEIADAELEKGEWSESGNGYFEMEWDENCPKADDSLKTTKNLKPTTLDGSRRVVDDSRTGSTDPVTPIAESYNWTFAEEHDAFDLVPASSKTSTKDNISESSDPMKLASCPPPLPSKNDRLSSGDIVLTIYTETAAGCTTLRSVTRPEAREMNIHQDVKDSSGRIRCLHNAVLVTGTDWCESWRTEATVDAGHLLPDPGALASSSYTTTQPRYSGATVYSPVDECGKVGALSCPCSSATSESGRMTVSTDRDYFKIPASSYSGPVSTLQSDVRASDRLDAGMHDPRIALQRRSTAAPKSDDSRDIEIPKSISTASGSLALREQSPRSDAVLDTKIRLGELGKDADQGVQAASHRIDTSLVEQQKSVDVTSDLDEDGSSVDPQNVLVPTAQTVAGLDTAVILKPIEQLIHTQDGHKARKAGKIVAESRKITPDLREKSNQAAVTGSESSSGARAVGPDAKPLSLNSGLKSQNTSTMSDKAVASKHPKTKPPTPKSFPKSPSFPDGQLSSRRCFSDLDVADHDEPSPDTASSTISDGKGASGKGTANSVDHTRMNRTFALRCARREANDGTDASRTDNLQRSTRTAKKTSGSKFDDVQRSRSASRSRPGVAGPRSLFESSRSAETSGHLGQRVAKKTQEKEKKTQQTPTTDGNTFSRSLMRDDESNLQKSTPAFRPPNATRTTKKKNPNSGKSREDVSDGASGVTVKGSPVQSRPLSSSPASQESTANESSCRKKYNARHSMQTEASLRKVSKAEVKPLQGSGAVEKTDSRQRNKKKLADSSTKNAPSPSSDWTDDEKLQLTPRGRDLPAVCKLSARVKLLSDQVLQALRKRPEFKVNELMLRSPKQTSSDTDSLENPPPEFLYIFHNLEAAERQMTAVFKVLSTHN